MTARPQIKERYPKTSSSHMMCHVNLWCSLYFFCYAFLFSGAPVRSFAPAADLPTPRGPRGSSIAPAQDRAQPLLLTPRPSVTPLCPVLSVRPPSAESGWEAVRFLAAHRDAAVDIAVFCLCGIVGQARREGRPGAPRRGASTPRAWL